MNISLTPELTKLVREKVASGMYRSASEVIREALRILEEKDRLQKIRIEQLRKEIQIGLTELERGEVLSEEEVFGGLRERLERTGERKL